MSSTVAASSASDTSEPYISSASSADAPIAGDTSPASKVELHEHVLGQGIPVFWLLLSFRVLNALVIRTFFQPDEYFQALEPAWQIAFGEDSGAWITWEWRSKIRSTLHPYFFSMVYWLADQLSQVFHLSMANRAEVLVAAPKVTQALFAATGDFYTWKLARLVYGEASAEPLTLLVCMILNPFHFFITTRTLSNCMESVFTTIGLYLWFTSAPDSPNCEIYKDLAEVSARSSKIHVNSSRNTMMHRKEERSGSAGWISDKLERSSTHIRTFVDVHVRAYNLNRLRLCLIMAAVACVLRITNMLNWLMLTSFEFIDYHVIWFDFFTSTRMALHVPVITPRLRPITKPHMVLIREAVLCGSLVLFATLLLDRQFYGTWTFPPYHFLYINVVDGIADFYGVHDYSWYFSQAFPVLLGPLIFFVIGPIRQNLFSPPSEADDFTSVIKYEFTVIAVTVPFVFSFISHKEIRFVYPLLPVLHVLVAEPITQYMRPIMTTTPLGRIDRTAVTRGAILSGIALMNILAALLITQYHQCAPIHLMDYLRHEHERLYLRQPPATIGISSADTTMTVGFLMPCHSTPWRSHLVHPGIKAWALGCEPPLQLPELTKKSYRDEADQFYDDPEHFLKERLGQPPRRSRTRAHRGLGMPSSDIQGIGLNGSPGRKMWPEYLVFFEEKEPILSSILRNTNYIQCWRGWNSWIHDDWRRRGDVIVWCNRV